MVSLNVSEPGATVERISYGERIILRPDPVPMDRGYEKGRFHIFKYFSFSCFLSAPINTAFILLEPLGLRDPYSRDPYYERRPDPYLDRREYSRDRDLYREKLPPEYERERFERDRYPRERDDRYHVPWVLLTSSSHIVGTLRLSECVMFCSICLSLIQAYSPRLKKGTVTL